MRFPKIAACIHFVLVTAPWDRTDRMEARKYVLRNRLWHHMRCRAIEEPGDSDTMAQLVVVLADQKKAVMSATALYELMRHYSNDIKE